MELRDEQQATDLGEPRACATVGGRKGNGLPWECVQGWGAGTRVRVCRWNQNLYEGDMMPLSDL